MQYIYFGLVPFLVAAALVYRGWYSKKPTRIASQLLWVLLFAIVYSFVFNVVVGVGCGLLTAVILSAWGNAVRKEEQKPSTYAEVSRDSYREYEQHMNEVLGLSKGSSGKKARLTSKQK